MTPQQHRLIRQTPTPKAQGTHDTGTLTESPGVPQRTKTPMHTRVVNQTITLNECPAQVYLVDDNDNNVKPQPIAGARKGIIKGTVYLDDDDLPPGRKYFSKDSDDSYISDDDGHGGCSKGEYDACPDKPANYYMHEQEDGDHTVIDVFNTNRVLLRDDDSQTESFSSSGGDGFENEGFDHDVVAIN